VEYNVRNYTSGNYNLVPIISKSNCTSIHNVTFNIISYCTLNNLEQEGLEVTFDIACGQGADLPDFVLITVGVVVGVVTISVIITSIMLSVKRFKIEIAPFRGRPFAATSF